MQLTPEQLRKAAVAALDAVGERGCNNCLKDLRFALGIGTVETMITAAFAAVEPPQVDVPGDLHKKAEMAAWEALGHGSGLVDSIQMMTIVGTVLRVALEDPRVLGDPTDDEFWMAGATPDYSVSGSVARRFLANRRARLLQPVRVEDRVEAFPTGHTWCVVVDKDRNHKDTRYNLPDENLAQGYRLGLIAKLKGDSQ